MATRPPRRKRRTATRKTDRVSTRDLPAQLSLDETLDFLRWALREARDVDQVERDDGAVSSDGVRFVTREEATNAQRMLGGLAHLGRLFARDVPVGKRGDLVLTRFDIELAKAHPLVEDQLEREASGKANASERPSVLSAALGLRLSPDQSERAASFRALDRGAKKLRSEYRSYTDAAAAMLQAVFNRSPRAQMAARAWIREHRIGTDRTIPLELALLRKAPAVASSNRDGERLLDFFLRRVLRLDKRGAADLVLAWLFGDSLNWPANAFHQLLPGDPASLVRELQKRNGARLDLESGERRTKTRSKK